MGMGLLLCVVIFPSHASAAWNNPTCNPDGPGGPTDPTCNVAAPLNVSASAQTKAGQLTIQNTLRAGDLFISSTIAGNGTINVETSAGKSIVVTNNDPAAQAMSVKSASSAAAVYVIQNGNGAGVTVSANGTGDGINIQTAASVATGLKVTHNGATSPGISVTAPGLGQRITTSNNGSTGLNVTATGSTSTGIVVSSGGGGISSNVTGTNYSSRFCNASTRCANFGGSLYAGFFEERTRIETSGATNAPLLEVTHSNTSASPGSGIQVRQTGTGQTLTPITAPQGVAVDTQAASSYAVYAYSQLADAGYFRASGDNTSALFVKHTNPAVVGQSNYGIEVEFDGGSGSGIRVSAPTGNAGQFISGNGKVALSVTSAKNPTTNEPGTGLIVTGGTGGTGLYAYADYDGAIGGGTGILAVGNDGSTPLRVTTNNTASNATAILVEPDTTDTGISIQNASVNDTALQTNGGVIRSDGQILGGQFYAREDDSTGIFENSRPRVVDTTTIGSAINDMIYDGSDIWVTNTTSSVYRISGMDGRIIKTHTMSFIVTKLVLVDDQIYVFGKEIASPFTNRYAKIPLHDNFSGGTTALNTVGVDFTTATFDGAYLWLGATDTVYRMTPNGTTLTAVSAMPSSAGIIYDLVYADSFLWASASNRDSVLKITPSTAAYNSEITVGDEPRGMVYDGRYLWVANYLGNSIERVDTVNTTTTRITGTTTPYYLTFDGVNIWYTSYTFPVQQLRSYNVAQNIQDTNERVATGARPVNVLFDGTFLWVARTYSGMGGAHTVLKVATGKGHGDGSQPVRRGFLMYSENNTLYCVYVNTLGSLTATTTMTQCTN